MDRLGPTPRFLQIVETTASLAEGSGSHQLWRTRAASSSLFSYYLAAMQLEFDAKLQSCS